MPTFLLLHGGAGVGLRASTAYATFLPSNIEVPRTTWGFPCLSGQIDCNLGWSVGSLHQQYFLNRCTLISLLTRPPFTICGDFRVWMPLASSVISMRLKSFALKKWFWTLPLLLPATVEEGYSRICCFFWVHSSSQDSTEKKIHEQCNFYHQSVFSFFCRFVRSQDCFFSPSTWKIKHRLCFETPKQMAFESTWQFLRFAGCQCKQRYKLPSKSFKAIPSGVRV